MQKSGLADNSSISSFLSYTFLSNAVDKSAAKYPPAENPITPILFASMLNSSARARIILILLCASIKETLYESLCSSAGSLHFNTNAAIPRLLSHFATSSPSKLYTSLLNAPPGIISTAGIFLSLDEDGIYGTISGLRTCCTTFFILPSSIFSS